MKPIKRTKEEWLSIVKDAIDNNEKIALTHGYKYKGANLGTFLIDVKRRNREDLIQEIESYGFLFKYHSKKKENILEKFIHELWNHPNPIKVRFLTKFNMYILPNKKQYDDELIDELNIVWKLKFDEDKKWKKNDHLSVKQKINRWKKIRYNQEINPSGKWYTTVAILGRVYKMAYKLKRSKEEMNKVLKYFNEQEILEFINEGFELDNPYYKKPSYKRITKKDKIKLKN